MMAAWLSGLSLVLWCIFWAYTDKSAVTRLGTESGDDVLFVSYSQVLCQAGVRISPQ